MKVIAYILLACALVASVAADYATNVRINNTYVAFMQQFQAFVWNNSYQAVLEAYGPNNKTQSVAEIQKLANNITETVLAEYKPIAYKIIYDAGYNTKGNYYIFDNTTKSWHLPNQASPAIPVDGAAVNAKQLSKELETAFVGIMPKEVKASGLQKRFLGRFFASVDTTSFLRNIEMKPAKEILTDLAAYRQSAKELLESRPRDKELLDAFEINFKERQEWRKSTSELLDEGFFDTVDNIPSYNERKSKLDEKLKEIMEKKEKTDIDNKDIAVIQNELEWVDNLIKRDAKILLRSRIPVLAVFFFA